MLYFVKAELKGALPFALEKWHELLIKTMEIELGYKEQGKILALGDFAGRKGGCYIYDVESNEELHKLLGRIPVFPFHSSFQPTIYNLDNPSGALSGSLSPILTLHSPK